MRFDFISFLIGCAVASAVAFAMYRFRAQLGALRGRIVASVRRAKDYLSSSADARYHDYVVKALNAEHLAGDRVALTDLYIAPRFLAPAPLADPNPDEFASIFHVVPQVHEFPASYAPYNMETLSVNDLRAGERHLALLGLPGSGRSTALAVIGLTAAGMIETPALDAMKDEYFEEELKGLDVQERERRINKRRNDREAALRKLREAQAKRTEEARPSVDWRQFVPIMVHLREIDLSSTALGLDSKETAGKTISLDPAEPLVRALQKRAGGMVASLLPRVVYSRLTAGTALVMLDGFDELPPAEQALKLGWLERFRAVYQANFIIVTGGVTGFDGLANIGFTPTYLRAWADNDYDDLILRWREAWPQIGKTGRRAVPPPEDKIVRRVAVNNRARTPMDVTLKIWAAFADDEKESGRRGGYDFYVRRYGGADRPLLEQLAALIADGGGEALAAEPIKALVTASLTGEDGKPKGSPDEATSRLLGNPLLQALPDGRCAFRHPLVGAFLAAEALTAEKLPEAALKPAWETAMPFAAMRLPFEKVAQQRTLQAMPDVLYTALFSLVPCLIDAPASAAWKGDVFKRLGAALLLPSQFPRVREQAVAALVSTRDKGVLFILREGLKSPLPVLRRLCCVGIGALGETDGIKELAPMLEDADHDVQLAAGMALAAIGSETALQTMMNGLLNGDRQLRRAIAEALAAIPGAGQATLRDAITADDLELRRAAVYGIARIRAPWALAQLFDTLINDAAWEVKSAADDAFKEAQRPDRGGVEPYPLPETLEWLVAWAAERGDGVPAGPGARNVLVRVLQEGDPLMRATAARTIGQLGHVSAMKALYTALKDPEMSVRAAVYDALAMLQNRVGDKLPAVN